MSKLTPKDRKATRTVGTRYPVALIPLLDSIAIRRRLRSRADLIEDLLNREIEREFPGALDRAA